MFSFFLQLYLTLRSFLMCADNFKTPSRPLTKPLRMSVSDIYKSTGSGYCVAGRVETGVILAGEKVMVQPQNEVTTVKGKIF